MNDADLILALRKTLEDHRMSRGEKKALRSLISGAHLDERRCAMLRAQAFDLAREQAAAGRPPERRRARSPRMWDRAAHQVCDGGSSEAIRHVPDEHCPFQRGASRIVAGESDSACMPACELGPWVLRRP